MLAINDNQENVSMNLKDITLRDIEKYLFIEKERKKKRYRISAFSSILKFSLC